MHTSRRHFLVMGGAATAAVGLPLGCKSKSSGGGDSGDKGAGPTPAPTRDAEPPRWAAPGDEDVAAFPWATIVGDVRATSALASVRSEEPALSVIVVAAVGSTDWQEVSRIDALPVVDGRLQVTIDGLAADTAHCLIFTTDDGGARSAVVRFRTALADDGWRILHVGATCCFGGNAPLPSLAYAAAEDLDVFLMLGDAVYAEAETLDQYRDEWDAALLIDGLREITQSTSVVATWDDHEVGNNWSMDELADGQFDAALQAFREALPQSQGPGGTGIWRSLRWGAVLEIFVLDCRGERDGVQYISSAQMDWLKAGLSTSTARFKFILNSVPITDMSAMLGGAAATDRWDGFPTQRAEILSHIHDQGVGGVLWLAGDLHFGQIGWIDPVGGVAQDQLEVLVGPVGRSLNPVAELYAGDPQYMDLVSVFNWTRFACDPGTGTVRVWHVDDAGQDVTDRVLTL